MTPLSSLQPGTIFRRVGGTRRWRFDKLIPCAVSGDSVRAIALDPPERNDGRGLPGGSNEVDKGQADYWAAHVAVEVTR